MNRFLLAAAASHLALCACAGRSTAAAPALAAAGDFMPATRMEERAAPASSPASPVIAALAGRQELLPRPADTAAPERGTPAARVEAANLAAAREPSRHSYVEAMQVYAWSEGALYRLYTAPERVSEIALQPGEDLVSVAAGDTARWVIGDTTSGSGDSRRIHVLVKPIAAGLRTNLVITTNRRVYHVQLESTPRTAMAGISWRYPHGDLLALSPGKEAKAVSSGAGEVDLDALRFDYRIDGDAPPWRPVRAFDDGRQVFIEFPATLELGEAPPLFVIGMSGRPELVNYRVRGRFYVVDRLFAAAELRLGEKRQEVVRIRREDADRRDRRGRGR